MGTNIHEVVEQASAEAGVRADRLDVVVVALGILLRHQLESDGIPATELVAREIGLAEPQGQAAHIEVMARMQEGLIEVNETITEHMLFIDAVRGMTVEEKRSRLARPLFRRRGILRLNRTPQTGRA